MPTTECHRCRLLETEVWRLGQRQLELERRLQHLAMAVDRLAALVQALRRDASPTPAPDVRARLGAVTRKGDLPQ
jgi:hypothetical protein